VCVRVRLVEYRRPCEAGNGGGGGGACVRVCVYVCCVEEQARQLAVQQEACDAQVKVCEGSQSGTSHRTTKVNPYTDFHRNRRGGGVKSTKRKKEEGPHKCSTKIWPGPLIGEIPNHPIDLLKVDPKHGASRLDRAQAIFLGIQRSLHRHTRSRSDATTAEQQREPLPTPQPVTAGGCPQQPPTPPRQEP
jgi:hypothetical protein